MRVLSYHAGTIDVLDAIQSPQDEGFVWIDVEREEPADWSRQLAESIGVTIHEDHLSDTRNATHPSHYDGGAEDYDVLIFHGLGGNVGGLEANTMPVVFLIMQNALVTVRSTQNVSADNVARKHRERTLRLPTRPTGLLHQILDAMIDRFLALREPMTRQLEEWQRALLDPQDPFSDWMMLLAEKNRLRRLVGICEDQEQALVAFRGNAKIDFDEFLSVRFNDLIEHVQRVLSHAEHKQAEIDSLVQLHFSAVAHRTNEVMRVLTVLTAIFLPLTLIAGIFGMNFDYMPELKFRYGYFVVLSGMALSGVGLFVYFRRRNWL